jgi:HEPN domain-containing protein
MLHDPVCFHCQQSAEKYFKALLEELGIPIEKTHDLDKLLAQLLPHHPTLRPLRRAAAFLTGFAVAPRYPGDDATKRQAASSLRRAEEVRLACRDLLKLRRSPGKRKAP